MRKSLQSAATTITQYYIKKMVEVLTLHIAGAVPLTAANMLSFTANSSVKRQLKKSERERNGEGKRERTQNTYSTCQMP